MPLISSLPGGHLPIIIGIVVVIGKHPFDVRMIVSIQNSGDNGTNIILRAFRWLGTGPEDIAINRYAFIRR